MTKTGFPETASAEQDFRLLADNTPVMIWRSGSDRLCNWVNKPWLAFTGRKLEQEVGHGWAENIHPEDVERYRATYADAFDRRQEFTVTFRLRRRDGAYRWILASGRPYFASDGTFLGYFGSGIDVTDQKQAELHLADALVEREVLLREVQHRVRNNMQVVLSFINLFNRYSACEARADIKRLATHLQVLGEMQQYFHAQMDRVQVIELVPFLKELAAKLAIEHGIHIDVLGDEAKVDLGEATSVGLLAAEAILNAKQHAYPAGEPKRVVVSITQQQPFIDVCIEDEGQGIPAGSWPDRGSLGFRLLKHYAKSVSGELSVSGSGKGTKVSLRFEAPPFVTAREPADA